MKRKSFSMFFAAGLVSVLYFSMPNVSIAADLPALTAEASGQVDIGRAVTKALQVAELFPFEDYDVDELAERLGEDPNASFEYVRDHIEYEPYPGVLRGATGALAARAGNHYDRSLLLRALFDRQGLQARLVTGQLAARSATPLKLRPLEATAVAPSSGIPLMLAGLGKQPMARLNARAERDYQWLSKALADAAVEVEPNDTADIERAKHVWVQARILGEWTDFDTTLKSAQPGEAIGYFEKVLKEPSNSDYHQVAIDVVAESVDANGLLKKSSLLRHRFRAEKAATQQIYLFFKPGQASSGIGGAITQGVGMEKRFHPVLMLDGELTEGVALPALGEVPKNAGAEFFGIDNAQPVLARIHLDVSIQAPGRGAERRRTTLLDRVSRADHASRSYAHDQLKSLSMIDSGPAFLAGLHQLLISTGGSNPLDSAAGLLGTVELAKQQFEDPDSFEKLSFHEMLWPLGEFNRNMILATERYTTRQVNDDPDVRFYVDRPRVYRISTEPEEREDELFRMLTIDLIHDHLGWFARVGTPGHKIVDRRLRYGTLQSSLETTMVELRNRSNNGSTQVRSASAVNQPGLTAVTRKDLAGNMELYPTGLIEDVQQGAVVVTAEAVGGPIDTWWRFDLKDGSLVAKLAPNYGGVLAVTGGGGAPVLRSGGSGIRGWQTRAYRAIDWSKVYPEGGGNLSEYYPEKQRRALERLRARNRALGRRACGGKDYMVIFGCVSLPAGVSLGWAHVMIWGEVINVVGFIAMMTDIRTS